MQLGSRSRSDAGSIYTASAASRQSPSGGSVLIHSLPSLSGANTFSLHSYSSQGETFAHLWSCWRAQRSEHSPGCLRRRQARQYVLQIEVSMLLL